MAAALACAALSSCTVNDIELISTSKDIKFNITVADINPATKAIKQDWSNGDKLNVWFNESNNQQDPDIVLTYNGSTWETGDLRDGIDESHFSGQEMCKAYYEAFNNLSNYPTYSDGKLSKTVTLGGVNYSQMPMVLLGLSSYTFSENTVTAKIGEGIIIPNYYELQGWTYRNDLQVVITGLSAENAGKYTLSCPALSACTTITLTGSETTTEGAVAGVSNDDGVAFYFAIKDTNSKDYEFTLTDYTGESNPVVKTYTATGKTLDSSEQTKCVGIKIPYSSFAAAAAATTGTTDGHDWVQLWADGPKFATMNVGATITDYASATDYTTANVGGLYAWGTPGTDGRTTTWDSSVTTGTDDIATNKWGSNWREPTMVDLLRLCNCKDEPDEDGYGQALDNEADHYTVWTWCSGEEGSQYVTGCTLAGYKVSGKAGTTYANNSIFLPAAGYFYYYDSNLKSVGDRGDYWSSSAESDSNKAYYLDSYSDGQDVGSYNRKDGYSVRAVLKEN